MFSICYVASVLRHFLYGNEFFWAIWAVVGRAKEGVITLRDLKLVLPSHSHVFEAMLIERKAFELSVIIDRRLRNSECLAGLTNLQPTGRVFSDDTVEMRPCRCSLETGNFVSVGA